jgi:hypothetical protein
MGETGTLGHKLRDKGATAAGHGHGRGAAPAPRDAEEQSRSALALGKVRHPKSLMSFNWQEEIDSKR